MEKDAENKERARVKKNETSTMHRRRHRHCSKFDKRDIIVCVAPVGHGTGCWIVVSAYFVGDIRSCAVCVCHRLRCHANDERYQPSNGMKCQKAEDAKEKTASENLLLCLVFRADPCE